MFICENCDNYNPMNGEEGFCDRNSEIVEWTEMRNCHSLNFDSYDYDRDEEYDEEGDLQ